MYILNKILKSRPRRGFSNILSTLIISTVLLTTMLVTSALAKETLGNQMASSEFNTAKNLMISLDSEINALAFKSGESSVVKASFFRTCPGYTKTGDYFTVSFNGYTPILIKQNYFNIESPPGVGGSFDFTYHGTDSSILTGYEGTMGRVYISKPYNWRVGLDYHRARYTNTGIIDLFDGTQKVPWNTIEVVAIEMDFTSFRAGENSIIIMKNERIETESFSLSGDWTMSVSVTGASTETIKLSEMGGNPAFPTLLSFHKIILTVNVLEGS